MDWENCKKEKFVKNIRIDLELLESLKKSSEKKFKSGKTLKLNETTAESIIILLYDSLRELLEALAIKHGFKIYNHECYTYFLNSILNEEGISREFDSLRKLRNAINYYGQEISARDAIAVIHDIERLINKCKYLLNRKD